MFRVLLALLCLALPRLSGADFSAWKDSTRIFMNTSPTGGNIPVSVLNFPLLVRLDSGAIDFSKVKAGGTDLRFADPDGTPLVHEIELFDAAAKTCLAWVRVTQVDALSLTDHIVMYWNNPAAVAPTGAVFDTSHGYVAVYHFGENHAGVGTKAAFRDATPNGNHGDDYASEPRARSVIGYGQEFDGVDDRILVPNSPSLALGGPLSLSAWVIADALSRTATDMSNVIVRKGDENPNSYQLGALTGKFFLALDANDGGGTLSKTDLAIDTHYHLAATWDGTTVKLYINGALETEAPSALSAGALSKDARPLYIGGRLVDTAVQATRDRWDGDLDEVRITRHAHTPQHYKLSYENQKPGSAMLTFKRFPAVVVPENLSLWPKSRKIVLNTTEDGAAVAGPVERFPLLVRLDTGLFTFSQANGRGADVRFSDADGATLPYAIERWDSAAGKAEVWVKVPRVDGGSKADFVRMHWGMAGILDAQNAPAVFDTAEGFTAVWHLDAGAAGKGGGAVYKDQTAGRHHGQDYVAADPAEGLIGKGQTFGDNQDRIQVPSAPALNFQKAFTFSAWIKGSAWDDISERVSPILRKGSANPNAYQFSCDSSYLDLEINGIDGDGPHGRTAMRAGTWYHVASAWEPGRIRMYVNGALEVDTAYDRGLPAIDTRTLFIGGRDSAGDQWHGMLDEVQASRLVRGGDWIKLAYESQRPTSRLLIHEGFEHKVPPRDTLDIPKDTATVRLPHPTWIWDTTLASGQRFGKDGVFNLYNPGPDPLRVVIHPVAADDTLGAVGVEANIRILSPAGGGTRAIAVFTMDTAAAAGRSVYELLPGAQGSARLGGLGDRGGAAGSTELFAAGTYTVASDTAAPRLRLVAQGIGAGDSSWVELVAEDNIERVNLKCFPEGAEGVSAIIRRAEAGVPFRLAFKPQAGLAPLKLFLSVDDGRMQTAFPASPSNHHVLARAFSDLQAPFASKAGLDWGLFGVPVRPAGPLTLESLAQASGAATLYGALWISDPADTLQGTYRILEAKDTLPAGAALWLAAEKNIASLPLGAARSLPQGFSSVYAISLRRGWNLVASPSLESLPWVVSKSDLPSYDLSPVKGLHAYGGEGRYQDTDRLEPWKGYFVFSRVDTVVELTGMAPGVFKRGSPAGPGREPAIRIVLDPVSASGGSPGAAASLRLGAAGYAVDGLGVEDEPMPGSPRQSAGVAASRLGRGLRTDLIRYLPGRLHAWRLAWSGIRDAQAGRSLPASARLRLTGLELPEGMSLWTASTLRPEAVRLARGADIEVEGDAADTLLFWAAPMGGWQEGDPIPGLGSRPLRRTAALARGASGLELRLALPEAAGLKAALYSADGRRIGFWERRRLAPGRHAFALAGPYSRGLFFVTVEFSDAAGRNRLVFKALAP